MTLDQFYDELRKVTESGVKWRVSGQGYIRAYIPLSEECICPCPANIIIKTWDEPIRDSIVDAADNMRNHDPAIRAKLLQCCGLEERA